MMNKTNNDASNQVQAEIRKRDLLKDEVLMCDVCYKSFCHSQNVEQRIIMHNKPQHYMRESHNHSRYLSDINGIRELECSFCHKLCAVVAELKQNAEISHKIDGRHLLERSKSYERTGENEIHWAPSRPIINGQSSRNLPQTELLSPLYNQKHDFLGADQQPLIARPVARKTHANMPAPLHNNVAIEGVASNTSYVPLTDAEEEFLLYGSNRKYTDVLLYGFPDKPGIIPNSVGGINPTSGSAMNGISAGRVPGIASYQTVPQYGFPGYPVEGASHGGHVLMPTNAASYQTATPGINNGSYNRPRTDNAADVAFGFTADD